MTAAEREALLRKAERRALLKACAPVPPNPARSLLTIQPNRRARRPIHRC